MTRHLPVDAVRNPSLEVHPVNLFEITIKGLEVLRRVLRIDYCDARPFGSALFKFEYVFQFKIY